ncbi:MAG: PorP/SprF family type IX secretion system membrane protein [Bacteroidales bacterium]|nr:PorP/SprF family type IX secretion system membrane protein [Bacteroidales bacterium]
MKQLNWIKYLILLIGLFLSFAVFGQQAPVFTQYSSSYMLVNAGYAGLGKGICATGIARQQWVGFKDANGNSVAPKDFLISVDAPVQILGGGIGMSILQDQIGFENNIALQIAYSYHMNINAGIIGFGAGVNFTNRTIDFTKFNPVQSNDPALLNTKQGDMLTDANFGLFFKGNNNLYIGVSATNIFENKGKNLSTSGSAIYYRTDRTIYLSTGYSFSLPNHPKYNIAPSLLVQTDLASTQYNISTVVTYNNKFWGGMNYRFQESVGFLVGVLIDGVRVGYSYDLPTLPVGLAGSHEITVSYCFKIKTEKTKTSYKNTRYL